MIYFLISLLAIRQLILTILFIRFRRRVRTLFLKLRTYDELQDIDIDSLKLRLSNLSNRFNTLIFNNNKYG